jgi:hypothetical protein
MILATDTQKLPNISNLNLLEWLACTSIPNLACTLPLAETRLYKFDWNQGQYTEIKQTGTAQAPKRFNYKFFTLKCANLVLLFDLALHCISNNSTQITI